MARVKNRYTIRYQYGTMSGTRVVDAYTSAEAIAKLWQSLGTFYQVGQELQKAEIIDIEENIFGF